MADTKPTEEKKSLELTPLQENALRHDIDMETIARQSMYPDGQAATDPAGFKKMIYDNVVKDESNKKYVENLAEKFLRSEILASSKLASSKIEERRNQEQKLEKRYPEIKTTWAGKAPKPPQVTKRDPLVQDETGHGKS